MGRSEHVKPAAPVGTDSTSVTVKNATTTRDLVARPRSRKPVPHAANKPVCVRTGRAISPARLHRTASHLPFCTSFTKNLPPCLSYSRIASTIQSSLPFPSGIVFRTFTISLLSIMRPKSASRDGASLIEGFSTMSSISHVPSRNLTIPYCGISSLGTSCTPIMGRP